MKGVRPLPRTWVRNVDLMPPLSLQAILNEKQEVFYLKGHVSEQTSAVHPLGGKEIKTSLGVKINPWDKMARCTTIEFGVPDPTSGERATLGEIWEDVLAEIALPDVVIKERACIYEPPKKMPDKLEQVLAGIDEIYQVEFNYGYRRRVAGIPCASPAKIIKAELLSRDIIKSPSHPAFKRIRGVLLTELVLPAIKVGKTIDIKGWSILKDVNHDLQRLLRFKKFWQDTAIPWKVEVDPFDHTKITGYIYRLEDRPDKLLGI